MWRNTLHVTVKHNISQGKESKKWHVHSILNKYLEQLGGYMEDLTRNYPGVWTNREFFGIMSQHVATRKEGPNQGVVAVEVLCDDVGHPHGGPRVE